MTATAVTAAEFGRRLLPLLGADKPAAIAVAVSGGADSLALALLAADWAAKRDIAVLPLIVDHRLRPESTREARQVARWLRAAGLRPRILTWDAAAKPAANRQAAARAARYALLEQACAKNGVRHLLLAHHRDDQAETLLLRALRGSGVDGLAAMQPRRPRGAALALLRPLLDLPKDRLVATLRRRKQAWIEDPSNASPAYLRVRVRQALDLLSGHDGGARAELVTHLAQTARNFGRIRALLDEAAYDLLHRAVQLHPAGIAWLDATILGAAGDEIALRALGRLLAALGGQPLPPRLDGLERLLDALRAKTGLTRPLTLHRCLLAPQTSDQPLPASRLLICREARYLPQPLPLRPGQVLLWDGRFRVTTAKTLPRGLSLAPLGRRRPQELGAPAAAVPRAAWPSLPALCDAGGAVVAVPGLGCGRLPAGVTFTFRPGLDAGPDSGAAA